MADIIDIKFMLEQRKAIPKGTVTIDQAEAMVIIKALYKFKKEALAGDSGDEFVQIGSRIANDVILRVGEMFSWK